LENHELHRLLGSSTEKITDPRANSKRNSVVQRHEWVSVPSSRTSRAAVSTHDDATSVADIVVITYTIVTTPTSTYVAVVGTLATLTIVNASQRLGVTSKTACHVRSNALNTSCDVVILIVRAAISC
jgi:hypothetical protein